MEKPICSATYWYPIAQLWAGERKKSKSLLPSATGKAGEMILVMDSAKWEGTLGEAVRETFLSSLEGLPRHEPYFSLKYVDPRKLNPVLKRVKNVVFVSTFDSKSRGSRILKGYFTKSSLEKIKNDPSLYVYNTKDEFAKGQAVMYLFGNDESTLVENIKNNKEKLVSYFDNVENERLHSALYKSKEVKGVTKMLKEEHKCSMRIPFKYQLVQNQGNFIWVRHADVETDKSIFISYRPYTTEKVFERDSIVALRNEIAGQYLFDDPENPESYVTTESMVPVYTKTTTFDSKYAVEARGLWKTNNISMGGPFLSYTFVDEKLNRLYYIEGFLYSPGKAQRESIRELEVILKTFRTNLAE